MLIPAYDLLCTRIHSSNESNMALSLFEEFSKAYPNAHPAAKEVGLEIALDGEKKISKFVNVLA